jgi:phosphatidylglycerophosphate synthase
MVVVILGREMYVTALRGMTHARGQSLPASLLGKIKLIAQVTAILVLILGKGHMQGFFILGQVALWIAMLAAVISAVDYTMKVQGGQSAPPAGKQPGHAAEAADSARRGRISA